MGHREHRHSSHHRHRHRSRNREGGDKQKENDAEPDMPTPQHDDVPTWSPLTLDPSGLFRYQAYPLGNGEYKYNIVGLEACGGEIESAPMPPASVMVPTVYHEPVDRYGALEEQPDQVIVPTHSEVTATAASGTGPTRDIVVRIPVDAGIEIKAVGPRSKTSRSGGSRRSGSIPSRFKVSDWLSRSSGSQSSGYY